MVLVLDIYFGLSGMIILVSLPATGFFMCKSPLSLPLEDNQVTSQAVDPGWQNLAGHERSGKGTRLLAPRMQWQGCLWVRSCRHMPTSPVLGVCEQLVVWRQARGAGWLWALLSMHACWADALLPLCLLSHQPVSPPDSMCLSASSQPGGFCLWPKAAQPRQGLLNLAAWSTLTVNGGRVSQGLGGCDEQWEDVCVFRRWRR